MTLLKKFIEIYLNILLKHSASNSSEEISSSSSDDSYSEDSEVARDESRQVRYSELTKDKRREIIFF